MGGGGKGGAEQGGPVTYGYHYFLSMHLAVCHGPVDYVKDIRTSENVVIYDGSDSKDQRGIVPASVDAPTTVRISKPLLFGGKLKEGGVGVSGTAQNSTIYLLWGGEKQPALPRLKSLIIDQVYGEPAVTAFDLAGAMTTTPVNTTLAANVLEQAVDIMRGGANPIVTTTVSAPSGNTSATPVTTTETATATEVPAFRGVLSCIWDDLRYQSNSSRPKPWNFKVCRIPYRNRGDVAVITQTVKNTNNFVVTYGGGALLVKKTGASLSINNEAITIPDGGLSEGQLQYFVLGKKYVLRGDFIKKTPAWNSIAGYAEVTSTDKMWWRDTTEDGKRVLVNTGWNELESTAIATFSTKPDGVLYPTTATGAEMAKLSSVAGEATLEEANPAFVLLEVILNKEWGLGYAPEWVDTDSFDSAAGTLKREGFGISAIWENESSVEDFISVILNTVNGMLYLDPQEGNFVFKLIREVIDYNADGVQLFEVPHAHEDNIIEMRSYSRMATSELTNQVTVQWTDPILGTIKSATVHNPASREMQGFTVSTTRSYPAVTSQDVAMHIAARDLAILSQPLAQVELVVTRHFAAITIGEVIDWSWYDLGIENMRLRVMSIGYGLLEDGRITLKCIEDVFGVNASSFAVMSDSRFDASVNLEPEPPVKFEIINLNYVDLLRLKNDAGRTTQFDMVDSGNSAIAVFAASPRKEFRQFCFAMRSSFAGTPIVIAPPPTDTPAVTDLMNNLDLYNNLGEVTLDFTPYAIIKVAVSVEQTSVIQLDGSLNLDVVQKSSYLYCGGEFMQVVEFAPDYSTVTVNRAVISSVPMKHAVGEYLWFYSGILDKVTVDKEFIEDQTVAGTPLTWNGVKLLPLDHAGILQSKPITISPEWAKPYPPANVRLTVTGTDLRIDWSHRDAFLQNHIPVTQSAAGAARTLGIYYTYRVMAQDGTVLEDNPRYVGHAPDFSTYKIYTLDSADFARGNIFVFVKAVQGDLQSDWHKVGINVNSGVSLDLDLAPAPGAYTPVPIGIADEIRVSISMNGSRNLVTNQIEVQGDSVTLHLKTNIEQVLAEGKNFFSKEELASWFDYYKIELISMKSADILNGQPVPRILATHKTTSNQFTYVVSQNAIDHQNEVAEEDRAPQSEYMFRISVVDVAGNQSLSILNTFKNLGINASGVNHHMGIRGDFGTNTPTGMLEGDPLLRFVKIGLTAYALTAYPVFRYSSKKALWEQETNLYDFSIYKLLRYTNTPSNSTDNETDNTLWQLNADRLGFTQI